MAKPSSRKIQVGDRTQHFGGGKGTITAIHKGLLKYEITWDGGRSESYTQKEFSKWCEVIQKEETSVSPIEEKWGRAVTLEEAIEEIKKEKSQSNQWKVGDRCIIPHYHGHTNIAGTIIKYDPDLGWAVQVDEWWKLAQVSSPKPGHKPLGNGWWKSEELKPCSDSLTCAAGWASDFHSQDSSSEDSSFLDSANEMITAKTSSSSGIQKPTSIQTCEKLQTQQNGNLDITLPSPEESTSLQPHHHVHHSVFRGNGSEPTTSETVSQQLLKRSDQLSLSSLQLRMCEDYSPADIDLTAQNLTSEFFLVHFPAAGTMSNGKLLRADTLNRPSLEKDCSWLESPGALSSTSRSPGLNRLESSLVKQGILKTGQVLNPIFLEDTFKIPQGWTDPLERRAATQLLEDRERLLETASIQELQQLPSEESSTSTHSLNSGLSISFGKSYPQLLSGKSVTRRVWKFNHAQKFIKVYQKGLRIQALDKDQRYGGKQVGWITLTEEPYEQRLYQMPVEDLAAEGFPELNLYQFVEQFFEGILDTTVWVIRFKFEPLEVEHPGDPNIKDSLEKPETHTTKQTGSIYQYTANKTDKFGTIHTYPKVEGERRRDEDSHWYWGFSYVEKEQGKWRDKSAAIPKKKLVAVRQALRNGKSYTYILQEVLGK